MTLKDLRTDAQARRDQLANLIARLHAKCQRCRRDRQPARYNAAVEILLGYQNLASDYDKLLAVIDHKQRTVPANDNSASKQSLG